MSKARGVLAPAVILDGYAAHAAMEKLAKVDHPVCDRAFKRIQQSWTLRGAQREIILALTPTELKLWKKLGATTKPQLVEYRFLAIYRHAELNQEVRLRTSDRPPQRRTFRVSGHGNKKFTRVKLYAIRSKESKNQMGKKNTSTKTKSKKTKNEDVEEVDELDGLDELDELETEEPEVEEDDGDEEEAPKPKKKRASTAKKKAPAKNKKKAKSNPAPEPDDDEDDDEDEAPAPKAKKSKKDKSGKKGKKGKKNKGGNNSGNSAAGRSTKDLTGGVGTSELAEAASEIAEVEITGREVRVYLRNNDIPKDEEHGRYVWPSAKNKKFAKLASDIAAHYGEDEDDE